MYVVNEPNQETFKRAGVSGKVFNSQDLSQDCQFVLIEADKGHETTIIEKECMFAYYVVKGSGCFVIEGQVEKCTSGDLVVIPAGKAFTYKGRLKMLLFCNPAWREEQEVVL